MDTKLSLRQLQQGTEAINEFSATRGRPLLLKLKELWALDWGFDAIFKRIQDTGGFGLEARALIIHTANYEASSTETNQEISDVLGSSNLKTWQAEDKTIVKLYSQV